MTRDELLELAAELTGNGQSYALVTVVRAVAPTSAYVGAQAIVLGDGTLLGWIGGGCAQGVVIEAAQKAIASGDPALVRISNEPGSSDQEVEHYAMVCASDGSVEFFIQPYGVSNSVCVLGDTPAAEEARFLADRLNLRVLDTPADAQVVLIATQGVGDEAALELALRSPARHVLMIASRRKAERLRSVMRMRGVDDSQLERLQAPAGPDAGARTPSEIAMVTLTEVLACIRGRRQQSDEAQRGETTVAGSSNHQSLPARTTESGLPMERRFVNPVCGVTVDTANPLHVEEYEDVSYFFCCDGCLTTFRNDPAKYAKIYRASIHRLPG